MLCFSFEIYMIIPFWACENIKFLGKSIFFLGLSIFFLMDIFGKILIELKDFLNHIQHYFFYKFMGKRIHERVSITLISECHFL